MSAGRVEARSKRHRNGAARPEIRSAFLTAPPGTDTRAIRAILKRHGVSSLAADELDPQGRSLLDLLQIAFQRCDVVIAMVNGEERDRNVFFELGFALALNKPALIIADAAVTLPPDTAGVPYLRTALENVRALEFGLTQFLAAPDYGKPSSGDVLHPTRPLGAIADALLGRLHAGSQSQRNSYLQRIVVDALHESGVETLSENSRIGDTEIDIAVWSEDLEPWVRNPLLIEVKRTLLGRGDLDSLVNRLARAGYSPTAGWALVIYQEAKGDLTRVRNLHPGILFISAEEFLRSLRDQSFGELVRSLRNQRVHGKAEMPAFSPKTILRYFQRSDRAKTSTEQGKVLEDLACYLFGKIPGLRLSERDVKNRFESEEIDVAFWNEQLPSGLKSLHFIILIECKNWSRPVTSSEVSWFLTKIENRALDFGILIAPKGITGDLREKRDAHDIVSKALAKGIRMIVITREEIERLRASEELVELVKRKRCQLTVT